MVWEPRQLGHAAPTKVRWRTSVVLPAWSGRSMPAAICKIVRGYWAALGFETGRMPACDRCDERDGPPGRHRPGAGVARAREHRDDADRRPAQDAAGGQPDVLGGVLASV